MEIKVTCEGADYVELDKLKFFQGNLKELSEVNLNKLKDSIVEYGFSFPEFVWKEGDNLWILDGHQRIAAIKSLIEDGYELKKIPIVYIDAADEKEAKEKLLLVNSRYATISEEGLKEFIVDLDFDVVAPLLEIPDVDLDVFKSDFTGSEGGEDDFEEPKEAKYKVECGDIYLVGRHRLMCGDSTKKEDVERLMNGKKGDLMVTDPPYGVQYDPKWRDDADKKGILGNKYPTRSLGKVKNDDKIDWSDAYSLFNGNVVYIWHAGKYAGEVKDSLVKIGYEIISQIIWVKPHFALSRGDYHWRHEPCWYAVKKGKNHNWQGSRTEDTIWEIAGMNAMGASQDKADESTGHGTQKPIECMKKPIINNSYKEGIIYDPFGGSGSTLIACEQSDRICYMMELDEFYCSVILERWEEYTGLKHEKL